MKLTPKGSVLVVGGGIAGMQSALDLAESGFKVHLIEKESAIGGRMVQLDKTFPTNDCSMCTISPRLVQIALHPNIEVKTNTTLDALEGNAPRFTAQLTHHPRYVDLDKCKACGECETICPVEKPKPFNLAMDTQKAIAKRYPQAIPNAYGITKKGTAPCKEGCPAHVSTQGYVALIRSGKFSEALALILKDLPLPSICGRICVHPCEDACGRNELEEPPVAIRALKRFLTDGYDVSPPEPATHPHPKKVAVIGSGPAGLSAAYFLRLLGHDATVFETHDTPGGMLRLGVPAYRLPRHILDRDIRRIEALGVEIRCNQTLGRDITLTGLLNGGYDAVFLAAGLHKGRPLNVEGESLPEVIQGLDLLRLTALGTPPDLGKKVVVIGGGNSAIDVARTARRLGAKVTIVCLEAKGEMPAHPEEIEEAEEEGITIVNGYGVKEITKKSKGVKLTLKRCVSLFDAEGAFAPAYDDQDTQTYRANNILVAVGQMGDETISQEIGMSRPGLIAVNPVTLETDMPKVFAGGDSVSGPRSVIDAVAMGKRGAAAINASLLGNPLDTDWPHLPKVVEEIPSDTTSTPRVYEPKRPGAERIQDFEEVTETLQEEDAVNESKRCLSCGGCSECFQCETVCEAGAINHREKEHSSTIDVGAVILAPGFDQFDGRRVHEYGLGRYDNVITSLAYERLLSASGPTEGHLKRPSDNALPERIAWIQCVGSRDERSDRPFCSAVCCMFATKQAIITRDHYPDVATTIFFMDMRAYGKGFDGYRNRAEDQFGVGFVRGMISKVVEMPENGDLEITYRGKDGTMETTTVGMVVLSTGLTPSPSVKSLAHTAGIDLNPYGFASIDSTIPGKTERTGVFTAGLIEGPRDIPETVMSASNAAAMAAASLADVRHTEIQHAPSPSETNIEGQAPRVGIFVCRCGTNIARVVDVPSLSKYAATLPNVVHAEENLYTCSADTQIKIKEQIKTHDLNRVVVASCTPRTHESLFQKTLTDAGLNKYLFEMANIRDQCSWVHGDNPSKANDKAEDLVRMAASRAALLEPLPTRTVDVIQAALVLGGGAAGMTAALALAEQGFDAILVERQSALGGSLRALSALENETNPLQLLQALEEKVTHHPRIRVFTQATLDRTGGYIGRFSSTINTPKGEETVSHGVTIVATGGVPFDPHGRYGYGSHAQVITQLELETQIQKGLELSGKRIVMIQCVGSREEESEGCSRVCCQQAVKNANRIIDRYTDASVTVLYRDIRTYGLKELSYREARLKGVHFARFETDVPPVVEGVNNENIAGTSATTKSPYSPFSKGKPSISPITNGNLSSSPFEKGGRGDFQSTSTSLSEETTDKLRVTYTDLGLNRPIQMNADLVVLSCGVRPQPDASDVASLLKVPLAESGFFLEAHMKLRPLDFGSEGLFLAGLAHSPKNLEESIAQARGAAARAATILAHATLEVSSEVSVVDPDRCAGCLTCVRACPYQVPAIGPDKVAQIEAAACQGCGICASACPRKAITTCHTTDEQLMAKVDGLFDRAEDLP